MMDRRVFMRAAMLGGVGLVGFRHHRPNHQEPPGQRDRPPEPAPPSGDDEDDDGQQVEPGDQVLITGHHPDGFTVPAGMTYRVVGIVTSAANVVVLGTLIMRPGSELQFVGIDESKFVGSTPANHDQVVDSDIGLWIHHQGRLDAVGSPKRAWTRAVDDLFRGQRTFTVEDASGWQPGDRVSVAPSTRGDHDFEERSLAAVSGNTVTLDVALDRSHPGLHEHVSSPLFTEVINLTRDVKIGGEPGRHAHVQFTHIHHASSISHVEIHHVGPRRRDEIQLFGRYGLHFHMAGDAMRGEVVEGVVVRESANYSFVPHGTHGITLRDCVAYHTGEHAYWWDADDRETYPHHASFDVTYDRCGAFKLRSRDFGNGSNHVANGFYLTQGEGNRVVGCVSAGQVAGRNAGGFYGGANSNGRPGRWEFRDNVSHNNDSVGLYFWQNGTTDNNLLTGFVAYRNSRHGINHGAYRNPFRYQDVVLAENGRSQLRQQATGLWQQDLGTPSGYDRVVFDAAGSGPCIETYQTRGEFEHPIEFIDCTFHGGKVVEVDEAREDRFHKELHFVNALVEGRDMEPSDVLMTLNETGTIVRVQRRDRTSWQMNADGSVTQIPAFHPG
jgi:hypothetical protein